MAIQIKHPFISAKGDGTDATLVRPSNWNAVHSTTMATANLLGRLTAGAGSFEEIPISAYMAALLQTADAATLTAALGIGTTGTVNYTFATVAPTGWILCTAAGTIGDGSSGASIRAQADTQALWIMLYALGDTLAPVSGGRSGVALTDYNAHKTLTIPPLFGKSPVGAGAAGTGTSARTLGTGYGAETFTIGQTNLPNYTLPQGASSTTVTARINPISSSPGATTMLDHLQITGGGGTDSATYAVTNGAVTLNGGGNAMTLIQPEIALNAMVKL
jgi:microcystin-dependent protein